MSGRITIPEDAAAFFEEFFPQQFAKRRDRYPHRDSPGSALFEVVGVGSWGVKIEAGRLAIKRGKPEDTLLQISMSDDDFRGVFVERTQREIDLSGRLSDDSLDAFNPLFVDERKAAIIASSIGDSLATLTVRLDHEGTTRRLHLTPGRFERTEPRATVTMRMADFLAMVSGRNSPAKLFLLRRLKIRGDVAYAMHFRGLLS
jgi:hypothetical protein